MLENIATQIWISKYKVNQFITFLLDSYLIFECYPYFTNKSKEYNQNYEIYFNDIWILNYISGNFEIWSINENFVYLEVLKTLKSKNIYYYKKVTWSEIDFIIENDDKKIIAVEVKSANKDNIPKIFNSFLLDYSNVLNKFIVTTESILVKRSIEDKEVLFIPSFLISKEF